MNFDHFAIRTDDLESVRAFFKDVLLLEVSERPQGLEQIPGSWLSSGGRPIVHLIGNKPARATGGVGSWDHVAVRPDGSISEFLERLRKCQVPHSNVDLNERSEERVFVRIPGGPVLEAVFDRLPAQDQKSDGEGL